MNQTIISQFLGILKQLAAIVATLGTLASAPAALPSSHFGAAVPNVNQVATTTINQTIPYVSSVDTVGGVVTMASSSFYQNAATTNASSGVQLGNNTVNNEVNLWVTGTSSIFSAILLGPVGSPTSTTSTVVGVTLGIPSNTIAVGDPCFVNHNISSTLAIVFAQCTVTSVATTTASTTFSIMNGSSTAFTMPTTPVFRYEIHHLSF